MNNNLNTDITHLYDDEGNKVGVIIKYKEFEKLMSKLEDLHDLYEISKRKLKNTKTISLANVKKELFNDHCKK